MTTDLQLAPADVRRDLETIYRDGITARKNAFPREWVERMRQDMMTAFDPARKRERGAISRGPQRWYVEVHPEEISGFAEIVSHPWVKALSEAVLGPEYKFVEIGFDVPFQGAKNQPWHRDFEMPRLTRDEHRLTSLAFNLTGVDVTEDMGPFEIAPGTQWDDEPDFDHGMFPPRERYGRYEERAVRKYPQRGDISARTALTIHRGTENESARARPVLVLGLDGPGANNADRHDTAITRAYRETLPERVRRHLDCPVVDELTPITQKHTIEGLVMGDA
jgi:hypothetical protein